MCSDFTGIKLGQAPFFWTESEYIYHAITLDNYMTCDSESESLCDCKTLIFSFGWQENLHVWI